MKWTRLLVMLLATTACVALVRCSAGLRPRPAPAPDLWTAEGQAAHYGIDYAALKAAALAGDEDKARGMMALWAAGAFDGGPAEEASSDLDRLARRLGDRKFFAVLLSTSLETQKEVLAAIRYERGYSESGPDWDAFAAQFPKLSRLVLRAIEKDP